MSKTKLSVCGVIVHQNKFLIVKRSETDDFLPNCWEFPGGSVEKMVKQYPFLWIA